MLKAEHAEREEMDAAPAKRKKKKDAARAEWKWLEDKLAVKREARIAWTIWSGHRSNFMGNYQGVHFNEKLPSATASLII